MELNNQPENASQAQPVACTTTTEPAQVPQAEAMPPNGALQAQAPVQGAPQQPVVAQTAQMAPILQESAPQSAIPQTEPAQATFAAPQQPVQVAQQPVMQVAEAPTMPTQVMQPAAQPTDVPMEAQPAPQPVATQPADAAPAQTQMVVDQAVAEPAPQPQVPQVQPAAVIEESKAPTTVEPQPTGFGEVVPPAQESAPMTAVQTSVEAPVQPQPEAVPADAPMQAQPAAEAQAPATQAQPAQSIAQPAVAPQQPVVSNGPPAATPDRVNQAKQLMSQNQTLQPLHQTLFEKVKKGEVEEVIHMVREYNIDISIVFDVKDKFCQTPIFAAATIPNHELSFRMIKVLAEMGVSPCTDDTLKQTPLFYACRDGNNLAVQYLVEEGKDNVNRQDKYGQTPIYYAVREGHIATTQLLIDLGALIDQADSKNQRPIYYAITQNRYEMVKFLIDKGADIKSEDKKGISPSSWAKRQGKNEILTLLLECGGAPVQDPRRPATQQRRPKPAEPAEPKPIVNERKIPKRYMLTKMREGGHYSPLTDQEFEEFKRQNPQIAPYFELNDDGEEMKSISELEVPEVPDSAPICDHWEKAAFRMLQTLSRNQKAQIFANPVDWKELRIPDYPTIVKNPIDFGTIRTKLKEHKYEKIEDFMDDMDLVFYNCRLYNGTESDVGQIGVLIQQEYLTIAEQLYFSFYKRNRE